MQNERQHQNTNEPQIDTIQAQEAPELLQARLAAFAAERLSDHSDRAHIVNNLGSLALGESEGDGEIMRMAEWGSVMDQDGNIVPREVPQHVASRGDIDAFVAEKGDSHEGIEVRADLIRSYPRFAPAVAGLKSELTGRTNVKEHAGHAGAGTSSDVYKVSVDDKDYIVRIPAHTDSAPIVDDHVAAQTVARGVPHLERIVAVSYEDGVTVAEVMPGKPMTKLSLEDIHQVTDEQLGELGDTLISMNERGIILDPSKAANMLYDHKAGFGITDLTAMNIASANWKEQGLTDYFQGASTMIANAGLDKGTYGVNLTAEDYAREHELLQASVGVLERFRDVTSGKLGGLDGSTREAVLDGIEDNIAGYRKTAEDYGDPEWVRERIAYDAEAKRERDANVANAGGHIGSWVNLVD